MGREFTEIKCCGYGLNINRDPLLDLCSTTIKMMILGFSFVSGDGVEEEEWLQDQN